MVSSNHFVFNRNKIAGSIRRRSTRPFKTSNQTFRI